MAEFEGNPYWTADNPHGYSAEDLQHLEKEELVEVMKTWFFHNFEDPAEKTPYESAEGGYIYIWGGPYDASDVLSSEFGDYVPEKVINEVVAGVQADGHYDWAPRNIGDDDLVGDADQVPWRPLPAMHALKPQTDELTARQHVLDRLAALEIAVAELDDKDAMIGHNQPPEPLEDTPLTADDRRTAKLVIEVVRAEAEKSVPDVSRLDQEASKLRRIGARLGEWLQTQIDVGANAFSKTLGIGLAAALIAKLTGPYEALVGASQAIANWIGHLGGLL